MASQGNLDTHHKALSINLEASVFGSFAEIGAGQEVARWFFRVGGASATVAKTISAYDKEVSDHIYGSGSRYVSVERLRAMLEKEWTELLRFQLERGEKTRFFSLVDTVAARNYAGTNLPHGWMGLRFQDLPGAPPNDVILHVNLLDSTNTQEQEALGILGVNLLYASFRERSDPETFLRGIAQLVSPQRIEIDYVEVRGPVFDNDSGKWSAWNLHVLLVKAGLSEAVICPRELGFVPLIEALHKKAVVLAPGVFNRPSILHRQMMATALRNLERERSAENLLGLFCLATPPSTNEASEDEIATMLARTRALYDLGYGILLVQAREIYKISAIIQRFTASPIRFVVGISVLLRVFEDSYRHLGGSTLKAISLLFSQNVRIYAYPMAVPAVQDWIARLNATGWQWSDVRGAVFADSLQPPGPLRHLYEYLLASRFIVPIELSSAEMSQLTLTI